MEKSCLNNLIFPLQVSLSKCLHANQCARFNYKITFVRKTAHMYLRARTTKVIGEFRFPINVGEIDSLSIQSLPKTTFGRLRESNRIATLASPTPALTKGATIGYTEFATADISTSSKRFCTTGEAFCKISIKKLPTFCVVMVVDDNSKK